MFEHREGRKKHSTTENRLVFEIALYKISLLYCVMICYPRSKMIPMIIPAIASRLTPSEMPQTQ